MVRHPTRVVSILILLLALCSAPGAEAGPPTDQLTNGVDRVFRILKDPRLEGKEHAGQRKTAIVRVADELFDFGEMAKRSLGQHWQERTPAERGEFVLLYTDLIQRSYISKVDQHSSEKMIVRGETIDGDRATVRTMLPLGQGREMPLDYRMHNTDNRWQVYDISIDGISLVANYRAQFNKVVRTSSYDALVAKLRANQAEFSTPSASPSGKAVR
jgi:phospholipid transport system substrate-binding protein